MLNENSPMEFRYTNNFTPEFCKRKQVAWPADFLASEMLVRVCQNIQIDSRPGNLSGLVGSDRMLWDNRDVNPLR